MTPFELAEPTTLADAIALLDPDDPEIRPLGGGTALMLMMKAGLFVPSRLVSLRSIEDRYRKIEVAADGAVHVGAMTSLRHLERSPEIARHVPVIAQTMRTLSNVRIRNVATVGGHLAHADPHMDLPPVLAALGAAVTVAGPSGERSMSVEDLYRGYYETALAPDELLAALTIPARPNTRATYLKCTTRSADDWPALGVAVALEAEGDTVREVRIVVSAATATPTRLTASESILLDATVDAAALRRAGDAAADETELISDMQGSAAYKRQLLRVYVARAVRRALDTATPGG